MCTKGGDLMLLKEANFVVMDFETTQNPQRSNRSEIIEVGGVLIKNGKICLDQSFESYVKPPCQIQRQNYNVSGISDTMVSGAENVFTVLPKFLDFVGNSILVGQNILNFDLKIMKRDLTEINLSIDNTIIDTLRISRKLFTEKSKHDQNSFAQSLGLSPLVDGRHRALHDSVHLAEIFLASWKMLKEFNIDTVDQLLSLVNTSKQKETFLQVQMF